MPGALTGGARLSRRCNDVLKCRVFKDLRPASPTRAPRRPASSARIATGEKCP